MTLHARFHPEAVAELRAEINWYEVRGAGLGDRLEAATDRMVDTVLEWPESGAVWPGWDRIPAVRSAHLAGFPLRPVYLVQPSELVVIALAHDRRFPGYWQERVDD